MAHHPYSLSPELFEELLELWHRLCKEFGANAVAAPFVPMVGPIYGEPGAPKVMYIGKSTEGWDVRPEMSLTERQEFTQDFCGSVSCGDYGSPFWYFVRDLTEKLYSAVGSKSQDDMCWALNRVIWSNLMKIGSDDSWPAKRLSRAQAPLMEKLLRYELDTHRPDAIILTTNWYEWEFVEKVFGTKGKRAIAEVGGWELLVIDVDDIGARLYWTRHPERWKDRWKAEDEIAADFAAFFRMKREPAKP